MNNCELCRGASGGVPGNEVIQDGVVMCDYCHAWSKDERVVRLVEARTRMLKRLESALAQITPREEWGAEGAVGVVHTMRRMLGEQAREIERLRLPANRGAIDVMRKAVKP